MRFFTCTPLLTLAVLLTTNQPLSAQPTQAERAASGEKAAPSSVTDGAGFVGAALFQSPETYFDDRRFSIYMGAEFQKFSHEFLYSKGIVVLGVAKDDDSSKISGFRYEGTGLAGIALGDEAAYTGVAVGLSLNGDAPGVVPIALTFPIEVSHTAWLGSMLRVNAWIRGDTFVLAKKSRATAADAVIFDEVSGGGWLTLATEKRRKGSSNVLRGAAIGFRIHRTMGGTVVMLQAGAGANITPRE